MRWLDSVTDSMDMNLTKLWERVEDRGAWCAEVHGITKSQTRFSDWTTTTKCHKKSHPKVSNDDGASGMLEALLLEEATKKGLGLGSQTE